MTMSLTNRGMTPVKGQAAFSPNQPIMHTCIVSPTQVGEIYPGDAVTFDTTQTAMNGLIVVKKATQTDTPVGVVAYNAVSPVFKANDRVSIFDTNAYVYMEAGVASITAGTKVNVDTNGQVVKATSGQGVVGVAYTGATAKNDLLVIKVSQEQLA